MIIWEIHDIVVCLCEFFQENFLLLLVRTDGKGYLDGDCGVCNKSFDMGAIKLI